MSGMLEIKAILNLLTSKEFERLKNTLVRFRSNSIFIRMKKNFSSASLAQVLTRFKLNSVVLIEHKAKNRLKQKHLLRFIA